MTPGKTPDGPGPVAWICGLWRSPRSATLEDMMSIGCRAAGLASFLPSSLLLLACPSAVGVDDPSGSSGSEGSGTSAVDSTSAGSGVADSTTTDDGSESDGSESSGDETGPVSSCGDGILDEGEQCDDGNSMDADGCNADCVESGSELWMHATMNAWDRIAVAPDDGIVVARSANGLGLVFVGQLDADGRTLDEAPMLSPDPMATDSDVLGLAFDALGRQALSIHWYELDSMGQYVVSIGEILVSDAEGARGWQLEDLQGGRYQFGTGPDGSVYGVRRLGLELRARRYDAAGQLVVDELLPEGNFSGRDLAVTSSGALMLVGSETIERYDDQGALSWSIPRPWSQVVRGTGATADDGIITTYIDGPLIGPGVAVAVPIGADARIGPSVLSSELLREPWISEVAVDPAGNVLIATAPGLHKLGPDLQPLWTRTLDGAGLPRLAIDSTGAVLFMDAEGIRKIAP